MNDSKPLHVAVGVIKNAEGEVLISLRHNNVHQGGLWEFPGGKIEAGESVEQALARELKEELDILIQTLEPLIKINHQYTDLNVLLDVWVVTGFSGQPKGCEGQAIKWVNPEQLSEFDFPEANLPIIRAVKLPSDYAILNGAEESVLLENLNTMLNNDIKLIQARTKSMSSASIEHFFKKAIPLCKAKGARLLVNSAVKNSAKVDADGIHLTSKDLLMLKQRPEGYTWVAASCHNQNQLQQAEKIGVDFVVLAPVLTTQTHPGTKPMGWDSFKALTAAVNLPVYALGGMSRTEKPMAKVLGAQGIAGISAFLEKKTL